MIARVMLLERRCRGCRPRGNLATRAAAQVLQDALCGSSKVLLVCNLAPEPCSCGETLSSLSFAARAAQVELGQARRAAAPHAGGSGDTAGEGAGCSSSSGGGAADGDAAAAAGSRGSTPSPTKAGSSERASALRSSAGSGLPCPGSGGRPASRLSERASSMLVSTSSGAGGAASPRLSGAKPARH